MSLPSAVEAEFEAAGFGIRTILTQDLADVHRVFEAGMRLYCDPLGPESLLKRGWEGYIQHALADDLARVEEVYLKGGDFWVVFDRQDSNRIIAHVGVERLSEDTCELRRMSVSPTARRAGLGSKLVRRCEEFAAANSFKMLILSTASLMAPALGLYRKCGFEEYEVKEPPAAQKAKLAAVGERLDTHLFRKPITSPAGRWSWQLLKPAKL